MVTKLIGWNIDEYKKWAEQHKEAARTTGCRYVTPGEVRADYDTKPRKITGYASVFNTFYDLWSGMREQVAPGAFAKTIRQDDIRALWNHNPDYVLGRTQAETLMLAEDQKGLRYEIIAPDTSIANDLMISIKRKDVTQSSFGFNIVEQSLKYDKEKDLVSRTLTEVKLFDVSPVTFPASPQTEVNVRMSAGYSDDSGELIVVPGDELPEPNIFERLEELKRKVGR